MDVIRFIKNWTLPIAMLMGVFSYFIYVSLPFPASVKLFVEQAVDVIQPVLIFFMLFLTFCKIDISELRFCRWHLWLILIQGISFAVLAVVLMMFSDIPGHILIEGAMICLICPTATAAAVVTRKLGGDAALLTTYTMLVNLLVAFLVPLLVPLVHPHPDLSFGGSFVLILGKVFPLLLFPVLAAFLLKHMLPKMHERLARYHDLSFYLWAVALTLAIAVTTRSIVHSDVSWRYQAALAVVSLVCCALQFIVGRWIGRAYGDPVSAGQALGQKNTVLAIWVGYTFFTPVTAVAAGFYSVWHNVVNSYQLYLQRKNKEA